MKPHVSIAGLLSLLALAPVAMAELAAKAPTADAPTEQELMAKLKKASNPLADLKTSQLTEDPAVVNRPVDLLEQSDILCLDGHAALVPKRAILHVPKELRSRLGFQGGSKLQVWSEFYPANRGWISIVEVSRAQAEGKESFPEDTLKAIAKSKSIVVATYKTGPISVISDKFADAAKPSKP